MELIIQILMLFILINCVFKLSFLRWWQTALFALVCAIAVVWMYPYAIQQSKTQLADYLNDSKTMQNVAVLITVESAICFGFCFAALRNMFGKTVKRWVKPFYWYPGLLVFPVLFYLLTQLIFGLPGIDFKTIAYLLAITVLIALPLLSFCISRLIPEKELRLEVHFLISLLVCILGLITTVNGEVTFSATQEPINFRALGLSAAIFATTFLVGYFWNRFKWRKK